MGKAHTMLLHYTIPQYFRFSLFFILMRDKWKFFSIFPSLFCYFFIVSFSLLQHTLTCIFSREEKSSFFQKLIIIKSNIIKQYFPSSIYFFNHAKFFFSPTFLCKMMEKFSFFIFCSLFCCVWRKETDFELFKDDSGWGQF